MRCPFGLPRRCSEREDFRAKAGSLDCQGIRRWEFGKGCDRLTSDAMDGTVGLATIDSPVGKLTIAAHGSSVCLVHFGPATARVRASLGAWYPGTDIATSADPGGAVTVLRWYFDGDLGSLDEIEVDLHGTEFQRSVWTALRSVKAGTTLS